MAETQTPPKAQGRINWRNVLTLGSLIILVGTEVMGAAFAGGWALAGLFELGTTLEYIFMAIFGLLGAWLMVNFIRTSVKVEPFRTR